MTMSSHPRNGDVLLLLGTRKGSFILSSDASRKSWSMSGAHSAGADVFHVAYDPREGGAVFAAVNETVWGPGIEFSHDLGGTWTRADRQPRFGDATGLTVKRLWHVEPGREAEPGVAYAGVEPAALFKSEDGGRTWDEVSGLTDHPTRRHWQPGLGGLCLHSVVPDPSSHDRMWVGISAVGVFESTDGGQSWQTRNKGVRADFLPERFPEFGQCPHKLLAHPMRPGVLFQQNHCGVFRSDTGGKEWEDITEGLPSRFGFALGLHPKDPDTIYVLPEDQATDDNVGGGLRYVTDAKFRVFRSRNSGRDWEPLTRGLPQRNAYLHVLREGMATDSLDPCGVYIGTTTGQVFYSRNDGDDWELLIDNLPPINSVECVVTG